MQQQIQEQIKLVGDGTALGVTVATLLSWLPHMAALASLVWTLLRIYELKTVQKWLKRVKR